MLPCPWTFADISWTLVEHRWRHSLYRGGSRVFPTGHAPGPPWAPEVSTPSLKKFWIRPCCILHSIGSVVVSSDTSQGQRNWGFSLPSEDFKNVMWLLFIIHYLNHIHYLVRKCLAAHQYLSNVQKASKTAWNHGLKTTRRYAHPRYRRFGNFWMMLNKWRPIIADAVWKASLLKFK